MSDVLEYIASFCQQETPSSSQYFASYNPSTNQVLGHAKNASLKELDATIQQAQNTFLTWRAIPAPKRGELVRLMGEALRQHKDRLGSLVALEMGKSKQEGDGEVQEMIDMADFAVGQSRMLYGKSMHSERPDHRLLEQWHPLGPVGVISAYNFPVAVWSWNAFLAAICGNVVIWNPSPKTPLCAMAIQEICDQICEAHQFPKVFYSVISNDKALSQALVADTRVPLISFTGSSQVGQQVGAKVAERFGRSLLELGGNNAAIIDQSANLELAIPAVVFGAVGTAGQRCTTLRRLLVHQDLYTKVAEQLKKAYQQITIGDPLDTKHLMGPLIDAQLVDVFKNTVERAQKLGGNVLFGGQVLNQPGNFVEPTLIEAQAGWDVVAEENFCPILYLIPFENLDQAIAINNQVQYGLSSAIFTQSIGHAERFLSYAGSDCGIANVNIGTSGAEIGGAFGGEKHTGGGREAGSDAWKSYMRRQTVTVNWSQDLPLAQGITFNLNHN